MSHQYNPPPFLILSASDVQQALPMREAIAVMKEAFTALSQKQVSVPVRTSLPMPPHNANSLFMPVYYPAQNLLGIKIVTLNENNPTVGLPLIGAIVLLFDAANGQLKAVMDAESLTAIRTGAASGLATRLLASPDAKVAAVFGAGVQAQTQLEAISAVRDFEMIYVFGRDQSKAIQFVNKMQQSLSARIVAVNELELLKEADVICTATTFRQPLFELHHLKNNVLINAVGTYQPDAREISGSIIKESTLVVDQLEACEKEAGELVLARQEGNLPESKDIWEIGALTDETSQLKQVQGIIVFKSVGNAVQDVAAASYVLKNAGKFNLGKMSTFEPNENID